ncbi:MAG TPA: nucleotidyl transferase AbiEii/AbiGii toxin family protein [Bdellovibrionota bacterium]|nr:nucleotidyl transferase AbiEii/AbiGii toxin family protein [Bdellovibrionota bacterium]
MHTEILTVEQLEILDRVSETGGTPFHLAGGTALGLILGHRKSVDFDFFSNAEFDVEELYQEWSRRLPGFRRTRQAPQTLLATWKTVSVSFFRYRYPEIAPLIPTPWKFDLVGLEDIAAMKLEAVGGRGSRKDFIDLYFLLQGHFTLEDAFRFFERKFKGTGYDPYHRLRSLSYFAEADGQPMPEMFMPAEWTKIKDFFSAEVRRMWGKPLQ